MCGLALMASYRYKHRIAYPTRRFRCYTIYEYTPLDSEQRHPHISVRGGRDFGKPLPMIWKTVSLRY
jgi:hypothetical protein